MKRRPGVIALGVTGAVVVGGAVAYAAPDQARSPDERAAIERLMVDSRDDRDQRLVAWLDELTSPQAPELGRLEVARQEGGEAGRALPEDDPAYLPLLEKRQALTHEIAALWAPNEKRYQDAHGADREDLIVEFVSDNRSALERIRVQVEELDRQIAAIEEAR